MIIIVVKKIKNIRRWIDEKYGTKFPEFQQINLDTAKEVYGEKITVNKVKHQETKETPVSFSFIKDKEACETKKKY